MRRVLTIAAAVVTLVAGGVAGARAGVRVQEVDPEFPTEVTATTFQDGKVRIEGALEGLVVLVDLKAGEGWLVDGALKRYAGGRFDALAEELKKIDAQEMAEEGIEAEDAEAGDEAPGPEKPRAVEVKDAGAGERLLGYDTRRHQVVVDGELLEELWVAPKLEVAKEVDPAAFAAAMRKMLGGGLSVGQGYEESPAYLGLRASGYPLRQVLYFVGEKSVLEATSVAVQPFPAEDFAVPKGYVRIGYGELLLGEGE